MQLLQQLPQASFAAAAGPAVTAGRTEIATAAVTLVGDINFLASPHKMLVQVGYKSGPLDSSER